MWIAFCRPVVSRHGASQSTGPTPTQSGVNDSLSNLATVEINNQTIRTLGQWPWDRNKVANKIIELYQAGASIVVVPILFADPDRFGKDDALARVLKKTPTVIGQIPSNDKSNTGVVRGVATVEKIGNRGCIDIPAWLVLFQKLQRVPMQLV